MRILLLTTGIVLLICFGVKAQTVKTYYVINTWEVPVKVIPQADQIRYPEFRDGIIYYTNGKTKTGKFNYSVLYGEMHYLQSDVDTLVLQQDQTIKKVVIGEDEYYSLYGQGYVEVLSNYDQIKLARKQIMKIILWGGHPVKGYSYDNTYLGNHLTYKEIYNRKTQGLMKVVREVSYVFIDQNQRFYKAKQSVLLKLFPGQRKDIYRYSKTFDIDYKQPEDLKEIIEFAVTQSKSRNLIKVHSKLN
jgi:hypothetical protein